MKIKAIYKIKNLKTGEFYIGSTVDFNYRIYCHLRDLRNNSHHSIILQNSWNKNKEESFIFGIIEEISDHKELLIKEQFYINSLNPKYNICKIAGSPLGVKHTIEARLNMSKAHLGKKLSKESIKKRTKSVLGTKRSEEIKERMRIGSKNQSKIVLQFKLDGTFVKEWRSTSEAARILGFNQSHISACCRNDYGRKYHKNFIWKYKK